MLINANLIILESIIANINFMKKHILLVSLLSILSYSFLYSKEVSKEKAKTVAINFLAERNINLVLISDPIVIQK
jgi:hypothetical protein